MAKVKRKTRKKRILFILTLLLVFFVLQALSQRLLERKDAFFRFSPFYKYSKEYDVLFFGNSHVINGIYTMELWKDYGIAAYNMGGHANQMASTYWQLKSALEHSNPALVVVDCSYISHDWRLKEEDFMLQHESWDKIPLGLTKLQAALDITALDAGGKDKRIKQVVELLWNYSVFHNRWKDLTLEDFKPVTNREKGSEMVLDINKPDDEALDYFEGTIEGEPQGLLYIRKILELCREKDQDILLTFLPFPAHEEDWREINTARLLADEYGVPFLNYFDLDIVDFDTDLYDKTSHLNTSGARKATDHMGKYLLDHYDLPDRREDPAYAHWERDYGDYQQLKLEYLNETDDLEILLTQLYMPGIEVFIEVKDKNLYEDNTVRRLMDNIGIKEGTMGEIPLYGATSKKGMEKIWEDDEVDIYVKLL